MKIKTETKMHTIEMRLWRDGWNAGYEPDCFDDLEPNFPADHEIDEDGIILATEAEVDDLLAFWRSEIRAANIGEDGDVLNALTDDEIANGDEWILTTDVEYLTPKFTPNGSEYKPTKWLSVYDKGFSMPEGDEICVLMADDSANVVLPTGETFHCGTDGLRVRVMQAAHEEDRGTWCEGNRGGRLFI
jgi:hypothetical protein